MVFRPYPRRLESLTVCRSHKTKAALSFQVFSRLQNSPYFCVFKYARAVKQKVWNLSPHTPYGCVRLARFARVRLLRHALPISLLILRKRPTVLQSRYLKTLSVGPAGV